MSTSRETADISPTAESTNTYYKCIFNTYTLGQNQLIYSQNAKTILRTDGETNLLLLIGQSIIIVEVKSVSMGQHTLF